MKILHIINSTKPEGGGPIEAIRQADGILAREGHQSEIVCLDAPDSPWLQALPLCVHAVGPTRTGYRYAARYQPWLREHVSAYDCAIVHGVWLHPSYGAWRVCPGAGVPYFIYTHGLLDPTFKKIFWLKHLKKTISWKLVEHRVVRDATAVFFTCEEEQRLACTTFRPFACQPEIVPYCVGSPPGNASRQKVAFLDRFPECSGRRLILFISRIHPKKGCDLALQAFAARAGDDDALRLVMAGPDSVGWRQALEQQARDLGIADRVTWTGMLSGDLKWGAFRAADAFLLPSHQENFGIAVVEALSCGVPVLITSKINIWREIERDGAGFVGPDTAAGAEDLLRRWLAQERPAREKMRENALRCFATRFRNDEAAANLLNVLRKHGVKG